MARKTVRNKKKTYTRKKGGTVLNIGFKYTQSEERATWAEAVYPYGALLVSLLPKIDWEGYEFNGETALTIVSSQNNIQTFVKDFEADYITQTHLIQSKCNPICPYSVFGGAACELYQSRFPDAANLHETVDPTGDIDTMIHFTKFTVGDSNIELDDCMLPLYIGFKFTSFGEHFTSWLFDSVVEQVELLAHNFNNETFSLPDVLELDEGFDKVRSVGNLLVSRTVNQINIKIQVSTKVTTKFGTKVDHLLELIMFHVFDSNEPKCLSVKNIPFSDSIIKVQSPFVLLTEQIDALKPRSSLTDNKNYRHKLMNHCGRILYLSKLLSYLQKNKQLEFPFPGLAKSQLDSIVKRINAAGVCKGLAEQLVAALRFYQHSKIE